MKRKYTKIKHILPSVQKLQEEGLTHREIAEQLGYTTAQIKKLLERARIKKQELYKSKKIPKRRGRPRKNPIITQREMELEIKKLKMENELLRNFLQSIGRR